MEYELPRNFHNIPYYSRYKKNIPDSLGIANMFARKILYREQQTIEVRERKADALRIPKALPIIFMILPFNFKDYTLPASLTNEALSWLDL
jgi:hypothetical protein